MIANNREKTSRPKHFIEFLEKLVRKIYTPQNNPYLRRIKRCYWEIKIITDPTIVKPDENAALFFVENAKRVNAITDMLADEQSRNEYLGIVKFRQTRNKKDYPKLKYEYEYFFSGLKLGEDEVFIDCGAYIGDTIDQFLKRCPKYKQIVAFEPDSKNFKELEKRHSCNPKITLINAGVYDKEGEILFKELGGYSRITDETNSGQSNIVHIQVKTIDDLKLNNVSFIKMDIEGAELNALKGAEKTILKNKPKLAICIYHSDEDMIRIAEHIYDLIPEYKLYVRHYSFYPSITETVLYALIDKE
jgi:FkbM family methyltransferase